MKKSRSFYIKVLFEQIVRPDVGRFEYRVQNEIGVHLEKLLFEKIGLNGEFAVAKFARFNIQVQAFHVDAFIVIG